MSRSNCKILDTGDRFPRLNINLVTGEVMSVPDDFGGNWSILLFYRGHW